MEKEARSGGVEGQEEEKSSRSSRSPPLALEKKMKKILVAIDDSEGSLYALNWALHNLFHDADPQERPTLALIHVQQPFQHYIYPAGPAVYATTAVIESVKKAQEQNSAALLARALELCKGRPIKMESIVLEGDPKETICQAAEQAHADLLVVGSRGLGAIKRAFLGSVSDYCAHHAKCPILIVKPPK